MQVAETPIQIGLRKNKDLSHFIDKNIEHWT